MRGWKAAWAAAAVASALSAAACRDPKAAPVVAAPAAAARASGNGWNVLLLTIDTLRADHLGAYGYAKKTSPRIDALARESTVFDQAYTFWPKTRGSFVMMMTGRRPSQNGYSKTHPVLLGFNPTLAAVPGDGAGAGRSRQASTSSTAASAARRLTTLPPSPSAGARLRPRARGRRATRAATARS